MAERVFDVVLGFNVDPNKARQAGQAIDQMTEKMEALEDQVTRLNQAEGALNDLNSRIAATGAVVFAPLVLSATRYVDAVGKAEAGSRRWLLANEKISASTVRIGREATNALVPYVEALANVVDMASKIDPAIINAGVNIGGGLILVGAVGLLSANVIKFISAAKDLTAALIALRAQGGAGGALVNAGVGLTAVGVGTALGVGGVNLIGAATDNQRLKDYNLGDLGQTVGQVLIVLLKGITDALTGFTGVIFDIGHAMAVATLDLKTALADLIDSIRLAAVDLALAIANVEIAGKRIGDVLGLDEASLLGTRNNIEYNRANRQALANATEVISPTGERTLTRRGEVEQRFAQWDTNLQNIQEQLDGAIVRIAEFVGLLDTETERAFEALDTDLLDAFGAFREQMADAETAFYEDRAGRIEDFEEDALDAQTEFDRQRLEAQDDYNRQRQQQEDDFNQRQLEAQADFEKKQRDAVSDFNREQLAAQTDFIDSQRQQEQEFRQESIKALEDFNRERERAEQDHEDRLRGAAARLDATAVLEELRSHNRDRTRAEEDFSRTQSEREQQAQERVQSERSEFEQLQRERAQQFRERQQNEQRQFGEQQDKQRSQFEEQQRRADENFKRQLDRQQEHFDREQAQRESEFREQLREEHQNFLELQQQRRDEFRQQLQEREQFQNAESASRLRYYQDLQRQYEAFIGGGRVQQRPGQRTAIPAFAEGGLSSGGLAMLHAGEGVLNRQSTEMMMRAVGGFDQRRIQQFINNSTRSMGDMNLNFQDTVLSESQLSRVVESTVKRMFSEV